MVKHALVIEDQILIAMAIQDKLAEFGYDYVEVATSQDQATELARRRCPDLITADDRLEQGSGLEAIRTICKGKAIPVVFMTADPLPIQEKVADAVFLLKPFSSHALARAIEQATQRSGVYS